MSKRKRGQVRDAAAVFHFRHLGMLKDAALACAVYYASVEHNAHKTRMFNLMAQQASKNEDELLKAMPDADHDILIKEYGRLMDEDITK